MSTDMRPPLGQEDAAGVPEDAAGIPEDAAGILTEVPGTGRGASHLSATDALLRVGLMARCIAHDLNNHLTAAYGQLELARIRSDPQDPGSRHVWHARSELQFCSDLISYLMPGDAASIAAHDLQADPHEVLESVLQKYAPVLEAKGITLTLELAPEQRGWRSHPHRVKAPAWALKHVFANLIGNACDAMHEGGELHVSSSERDGRFEMTFRDTGRGIPEEDLERVFDPSFTTKQPPGGSLRHPGGCPGHPHGHGLGLAMCRAVVEYFGGTVSAQSHAVRMPEASSGGAAFTVRMPLADAPPRRRAVTGATSPRKLPASP